MSDYNYSYSYVINSYEDYTKFSNLAMNALVEPVAANPEVDKVNVYKAANADFSNLKYGYDVAPIEWSKPVEGWYNGDLPAYGTTVTTKTETLPTPAIIAPYFSPQTGRWAMLTEEEMSFIEDLRAGRIPTRVTEETITVIATPKGRKFKEIE